MAKANRAWEAMEIKQVIKNWVVYSFAWWTSSDEYQELLNRYNDLASRFSTLQWQYVTLQWQYDELYEDNTQLQNTYNQLNNTYTQLQATYNELQEAYDDLLARYNALLEENTSLKAQVSELQWQLSTLQSQFDALQQEYNALQASYTNLQEQYNSLNSNYTSLQTQYNVLNKKYNDMRLEWSIFTPATITPPETVYDKENWFRSTWLVWDGIFWDKYYNYCVWALDTNAYTQCTLYVDRMSKAQNANASLSHSTTWTYSQTNNSIYYNTWFALDKWWELWVYAVYDIYSYSSNKYSWSTMTLVDITNWITILHADFIPAKSEWYADQEAINAKVEEYRREVWYYTNTILLSSWVTWVPSRRWSSNNHTYTYALSFS